MDPRKADEIPIVHAEAGPGNSSDIGRAIDETLVAKLSLLYMKNMTSAVSPEDSAKRGRQGFGFAGFRRVFSGASKFVV
jgi:hypothetical protein